MSGPALRLIDGIGGEGHEGEIFTVAYAPDGAFVLTGGWDGHLRLWETGGGSQVTSLAVSAKPISACAISSDARTWYAGSMEGMITTWDAASHQMSMNFLGHTRPISAIRFSPDGQYLATTSWDKQIGLRKRGKEREPRMLSGHGDIVAGCAFTPDGSELLSWSHDGSVVLWDVASGQQTWAPAKHQDRVLAGAIAPDNRWAFTASRDGVLRLWDLPNKLEAATTPLQGEIRGCWFLLDAESAIVVTADGWVGLFAIPSFELRSEVLTDLHVETGDLSPSGLQLAIGASNGHVHFVAVEGLDEGSLIVTARQSIQQKASGLDRFFGRTRPTKVFQYACPVCHHQVETEHLPDQAFPCPLCRRHLRIHKQVLQLQ